MRRRELIMLLGATAVAWPLAARAQQSDRMRRIGVLMGWAESDSIGQSGIKSIREGLRGLGWIEGRNISIDVRWGASEAARTDSSAKELVASHPDVLVAGSTAGVAALLRETRTIPIVFVVVSDPIGSGFVETFAHPAGNVTGLTNVESSLAGKWPQLLKEIAPATTHAKIMFNPATATYADFFVRPFLASGPLLELALDTAPVRDDAEIESAVGALAREPGGGLVVMPDGFTTDHRAAIIALATRHKLPTIYPDRFYAVDGGLISYGVDLIDLFRRATLYVDRIMKGDKPADLPVQQPTKFEFVINLKTAQALSLTVPLALRARADEVIE